MQEETTKMVVRRFPTSTLCLAIDKVPLCNIDILIPLVFVGLIVVFGRNDVDDDDDGGGWLVVEAVKNG